MRELAMRTFPIKRLSAVVLLVTLLATIAPLGVSSHAQGCSMPCCAGGSCSTGACDVVFGAPTKKPKTEPHCEHDGATTHVEIVEVTPSNEIDSSEFCGADHLTGLSIPTQPEAALPRQNIFKPASFSKPCSANCCGTAAVSSQLRRSRDVVTLSEAHKPSRPASSLQSRENQSPTFLSLHLRSLSSPRAPPSNPVNA